MTNGTPHFSVWLSCMPGKIEISANGTRLSRIALCKLPGPRWAMKDMFWLLQVWFILASTAKFISKHRPINLVWQPGIEHETLRFQDNRSDQMYLMPSLAFATALGLASSSFFHEAHYATAATLATESRDTKTEMKITINKQYLQARNYKRYGNVNKPEARINGVIVIPEQTKVLLFAKLSHGPIIRLWSCLFV